MINDILPDSGSVADADAAIATVGFEFITFDLLCMPEPIDVGTPFEPVVFDASSDNYCYTDDVAVNTFVILLGFAEGDVIEVSGAAATDY